jgi:hypothetical protein
MILAVNVFFALFGVFVALLFAVGIWSLTWPSVKGKIDISYLDLESGWGLHGNKLYRKNTEEHVFCYSYTVNETEYKGANIKPLIDFNWRLHTGDADYPDSGKTLWSGARDTAKWYRPGAIVDVHYCPWRPQWSCLEPGGLFIASFIGAIWVVLFFSAR